MISLAFLAPDIVETIIDGMQPMSLTPEGLKKACPLPASWEEQHAVPRKPWKCRRFLRQLSFSRFAVGVLAVEAVHAEKVSDISAGNSEETCPKGAKAPAESGDVPVS